MPPILLKVPNFELTADAVAATTIEVMTTILGKVKKVRQYLARYSSSSRGENRIGETGRKQHT